MFKAWTDPAMVAKWWGPQGFTNPVCDLDARVGGAMRIVMRGCREGIDYPMTGIYREIVEPEKIVFTSFALDQNGEHALDATATIILAADGDKTRLTLETSAVGLLPVAAADAAGHGLQTGRKASIACGDFLGCAPERRRNDGALSYGDEHPVGRLSGEFVKFRELSIFTGEGYESQHSTLHYSRAIAPKHSGFYEKVLGGKIPP